MFCRHSPTTTPSMNPTVFPTADPTQITSEDPTYGPSHDPSPFPTESPSFQPTQEPTQHPTNDPTGDPPHHPTHEPTFEPSNYPTIEPTPDPTISPLKFSIHIWQNTALEIIFVSECPLIFNWNGSPTTGLGTMNESTNDPTADPTHDPTDEPTFDPTDKPISHPTDEATAVPTVVPSSKTSESNLSFDESRERWILLLVLVVMIAGACIIAVFLFMRRKMNRLQQEYAANLGKGEQHDIAGIDTEVAVQEHSISVGHGDGRAEGVSIQHEHATDAFETSRGIGDV